MASGNMILDVIVATNTLINVALDQKKNVEPDISEPVISYDELLYGFIGANAKIITILRSEGLEDFQIRKEILGYSDEISDLDALFFIRNTEGEFDPRTEQVILNNPAEKTVAEMIAVIFGIFVDQGQDAVQRFVLLQTKILEDVAVSE